MKLVTAEEMRQLERGAAAGGLSYEAMMERAGRATAEAIQRRIGSEATELLVLVGPGNNGGDGLVAARCLAEWGYSVGVYLCARAANPDPVLERVQALSLPLARAEEDEGLAQLRAWLAVSQVWVDALLGIGVSGPLRGAVRQVLACAQEVLQVRSAAPAERPAWQTLGHLPRGARRSLAPLVVAVDVPSGLNADSGEIDPLALRADLTVTFAHPKRGLLLYPGADWAGQIEVVDIGIPEALADDLPVEVATAERVAPLLPARPALSHKGAFGKAFIVAGCTHYVGAPRLAAQAAYRVGAGLVTLGIPQGIYGAVASGLTEPTFVVLPDDWGVIAPEALKVLPERLAGYDALLVGPGLGQEKPTAAFIEGLLGGHREAPRSSIGFGLPALPQAAETPCLPPLVLDADALNLLARRPTLLSRLPAQSVLTPHPGEMARLLGSDVEAVNADRLGAALRAATSWRCVIVLKGAHTVVASPDGGAAVIPCANAALATAGTGDVVAGAIVGLLAQGLTPYNAALCGAYLHALAGELWRQTHGAAGMLASDLLPLLPEARQRLRY